MERSVSGCLPQLMGTSNINPDDFHAPNVALEAAKAPLYKASGPANRTLSTTAENLPVTCLRVWEVV